MKILGIDPGFARLGYGIIEEQNSSYIKVAGGTIETKADQNMSDRLKKIYDELTEIILLYNPTIAGIEELFFTSNQKTAIKVAQARGVAILACINKNLKVKEFTPLEVKSALTGYGKADKKQVEYMVNTILGLDEGPKLDDETDALAIAICTGNTKTV